jgi:hypothetical protein
MEVYRNLVSNAETETNHLHDLIEQLSICRPTKEEGLQILESIRDTNLERASFDEKGLSIKR